MDKDLIREFWYWIGDFYGEEILEAYGAGDEIDLNVYLEEFLEEQGFD